jgi:hypothetical protein
LLQGFVWNGLGDESFTVVMFFTNILVERTGLISFRDFFVLTGEPLEPKFPNDWSVPNSRGESMAKFTVAETFSIDLFLRKGVLLEILRRAVRLG